MGSLAQQAADMLASDEGFRNQFDRNHPDFHGDVARAVDTGGSRVPEWGKAHANWKELAVREDDDAPLESYGPEWEAAVALRDSMGELKKAVQGLCAPLEAVVKAQEKLNGLDALIKAQEAPPSAEELAAAKEGPEFIAAEAFDGAKPGFAFKTGEQGVGYYSQAAVLQKQLTAATRAEKANARKRKALDKQIASCTAKLESTAVTTLRERMCCVDGTEFARLRPKMEKLITEALAGGMSQQHYREKWSVGLKRVTEEIFRAFSVTMLARVKDLKTKATAAANTHDAPAAGKENSPSGVEEEGVALTLSAEQVATLKGLLAANEKALSYLCQLEGGGG